MTTLTNSRIPKYRRQKTKSGALAFVEMHGRRYYLGAYNSPESKQKYHRLLAEYTESGGPSAPQQDITVVELVARFWQHAKKHYRKPDGTPTSELGLFRLALRPMKTLYGTLPAKDFGPVKLKAVRQCMIERGWARNTINRMVGRLKMVFRWAVENELVGADVLRGLDAVAGLRRGRSPAKETKPVGTVPEAHIQAIEPFVSRPVWAMVQLQLCTAARPGELQFMRPIDIDTSGCIWTYTPTDHKTAYLGHRRTIYIGPKGQAIIKPFLTDRPVNAHLFSPRDAVQERATAAATHRRANQPPSKRKTTRTVRDRYDAGSYRRAIKRACEKAGVPSWHPHQLRHNAATFIRKEYGLEAAQVMLGHTKADTTEIYAEAHWEKALQIAEKIG